MPERLRPRRSQKDLFREGMDRDRLVIIVPSELGILKDGKNRTHKVQNNRFFNVKYMKTDPYLNNFQIPLFLLPFVYTG